MTEWSIFAVPVEVLLAKVAPDLWQVSFISTGRSSSKPLFGAGVHVTDGRLDPFGGYSYAFGTHQRGLSPSVGKFWFHRQGSHQYGPRIQKRTSGGIGMMCSMVGIQSFLGRAVYNGMSPLARHV
jgi:hypothetical protein